MVRVKILMNNINKLTTMEYNHFFYSPVVLEVLIIIGFDLKNIITNTPLIYTQEKHGSNHLESYKLQYDLNLVHNYYA